MGTMQGQQIKQDKVVFRNFIVGSGKEEAGDLRQ